MPQYDKRTTREILLENKGRQVPAELGTLKVWLHNIRSMHNVGSAFRSCDAFGAGELVLSGYTPSPPRPEISKTALGAEQHMTWQQSQDPIEQIKRLKSGGWRMYGIEQTHGSHSLQSLNVGRDERIILFFGNEVTGLDSELLPFMDACFEIPQFGQKHSLNVSVTIGITLYHILDRCP